MTLRALEKTPAGPSAISDDLGPVAFAETGRRRQRGNRIGIGVIAASVVLVAMVVAALVPQLIAPYDPFAVDTSNTLSAPTFGHLLGTDENGRDILSRLIYGAQASLLLGCGAITIALVCGSLLGVAAGLGNRFLDGLIMRTMDVGLAFPELLLALVVIAIVGGGTTNALIAIGVASIPSYARLVRAQTFSIRRSGYVEAARALGISGSAVVFRHVLPNAVKPVLVLATIGIGTATVAGSSLSFLGLGTAPPQPEWGSMLATARNFLDIAWWYGAFPGLAITLLVISTTVVGRYLQHRNRGGV
jgi:peptide/nickel transport system permease protein